MGTDSDNQVFFTLGGRLMDMIKRQGRNLPPILLGAGLWLAGYAAFGVQPATGQEVAKSTNTCQNTPYTVDSYHCGPQTGFAYGQCSGYCDHYDVYPSDCVGPPDSSGKSCSRKLGRVQKTYYAVGCSTATARPDICSCIPVNPVQRGTIQYTDGQTCYPEDQYPTS